MVFVARIAARAGLPDDDVGGKQRSKDGDDVTHIVRRPLHSRREDVGQQSAQMRLRQDSGKNIEIKRQ